MPATLAASATLRTGLIFDIQAGPHTLVSDYPLQPGGAGLGPRPLELLLGSLCACLGGSMVALLKKQGQGVEGLTVAAEALRRDTHPTVLESARVTVSVKGAGMDAAKAQLALKQSEELICPIWAMLKPGMALTVELRLV